MSDRFDADYFLRGQELGISGYTDYRWMPDLTIPMAARIVSHLGIQPTDSILDFGCARGYFVRALRELGCCAWGSDTSQWARDNCDPRVAQYISDEVNRRFDWIIAKDVFEHIPYVDRKINDLLAWVNKGVFAVIPLSRYDDIGPYVIPAYEKDVTHIQRYTLGSWVNKFLRVGWRVEASYRVRGIKDNWYKPGWERGNGFITCRRIVE